MRVKIDLSSGSEQMLKEGRLREIALVSSERGFELQFTTDKTDNLEADWDFADHLIIEDSKVEIMAEHQLKFGLPISDRRSG